MRSYILFKVFSDLRLLFSILPRKADFEPQGMTTQQYKLINLCKCLFQYFVNDHF